MHAIFRPLLPAALGLLSLVFSAAGQVDDQTGMEPSSAVTAPVVLTGTVLLPNGEPAQGAVVVTSAGGEAVSDADGAFALEIDVPLETASIQVTAVAAARAGAGNLVASTRVTLLASLGTTSVGRLVLASMSSCQPTWLPAFGGQPGVSGGGTSGSLHALTVFNDGSGAALFVGGEFTSAGGVPANCIAKWNGTSWSALGSGVSVGLFVSRVQALAVFDDGTGEALYAGGYFTVAGGVPANYIAKWNGTSWSALGSGVLGGVLALTVFDDGSGDALYAGGEFISAGGVPANQVAKWNGTSWSTLGSGVSGSSVPVSISALTAFDDGSGEALYAGGNFTTAGGVLANCIAKWNGTSWSALGSGVSDGPFGVTSVSALTAFDDGGGEALYAGGRFTTAGGVAASYIAKWNGTSWSALGSGMSGGPGFPGVLALTVFDDGGGNALYAGGVFTIAGGVAASKIAKWNGTSWSALGSGMSGSVHALTGFDDGGGEALYACGEFTSTGGGVGANHIARWDRTMWSTLGSGLSDDVLALTVFDDGGGIALYAGGFFTGAGGMAANCVAKWDGTSWSGLGNGLSAGVLFPPSISALGVFDDGSGSALYAGGNFTLAGGVPANYIAKWDGTTWSALGSGMDGEVRALTAFDDGSGEALYAGGFFMTAGGVAANRVAKWNGTSWSALGSGMNNSVLALTVFDDGGAEALYAGGVFTTAGGVAANRVAKWDGTSWSALGSGMSGNVLALAVFDDGSAQALYAGGLFTTAGGVAAGRIGRWNGTSWSALGSGVSSGVNPSVNALTVFGDGSGEALYVGGFFTTAGGVATSNVAKWDGTSWSALEGGIVAGAVRALAVFDDGGGDALHAGGAFGFGPAGDSYLAQWGCPPPITSLPGCAENPATLEALAASAPLGAPLPLLITGSAATTGVGLVYFGAPGFDGSGCGTVLPGLGELMLALTPAPIEIASGTLSSGTCALAPVVPSIPALRGFTVHLQGAAVHLLAPQLIEPTNALAVTLGP